MHRTPQLLLLASLFVLLLSGCESEEGDLGDDDAPADDDDIVVGDDDDGADDDDAAPPTFPEPVELTTADGLTIRGTWQAAPGVDLGPAVLLLHQYGNDRHDYDTIWTLFHESGLSTLAIDFRSHGESDPASVDTELLLSDPDQLRHDLQAGLTWLAAQEAVDPARIGVMGLSVGANLAVVANHNREEWGVSSTVSFSSRLDAIEALAGTATLDLQSALYVTSETEEPQATDATTLFEMTAEPRRVEHVLGTSSHGASLLQASADARQGSVDWFAEQL